MLLTLLAACIATLGYSQGPGYPRGFTKGYSSAETKVDIHAGFSVATMTNTDMDVRVGYTFGVGIEHPIYEDQWFLQTGIDFTSKGAKHRENGTSSTFRPVYLDIPILAKLKVEVSDANNFVLFAGPYIGIGLGGKYAYEVSGTDTRQNLFTTVGSNTEAYMNRFQIGVQFGVGLELDEHFLVNLAGQYGFNNMMKATWNDNRNNQNLCFMLTVGYRF